jgi:hypothetical protein
MFNRLWPARRTIYTLLVSTGKASGDLFVSTVPLLTWLRRTLRRYVPFAAKADTSET